MDNSEITFRLIEKKDNKVIAELIREIFREYKIDMPGTVYTDPTTNNLFELFRMPGSEYWIAEENGLIIGGGGVYPTPMLPEGCAELVKLYLSASHRGRGIGRKIINLIFQSAVRLGYRQLYLESFPELDRAISLYEKTGFRYISKPLGNSGHFACNVWMIKEL
jgi:putative acetyltransferase